MRGNSHPMGCFELTYGNTDAISLASSPPEGRLVSIGGHLEKEELLKALN